MIIDNGLYKAALKFYLGSNKKLICNLSYLNIKTIYFILLKALGLKFEKELNSTILVDLKLKKILELLCVDEQTKYAEFYNSNKEFYDRVEIHSSFKNYLVDHIVYKRFVFIPISFYGLLYDNNIQLFINTKSKETDNFYKREVHLTFIIKDYIIITKNIIISASKDLNSPFMGRNIITEDGKDLNCSSLGEYLKDEIKKYL